MSADGSEEFDFSADTFDSRDVIARIKALPDEIEELANEIGANMHPDDYVLERVDLKDRQDELRDLLEFAAECRQETSEWEDGEMFIANDYFETYAQEFADDIGAINWDAKWPLDHIDWAAAAEDLQTDYVQVTLRGTVYWVRE